MFQLPQFDLDVIDWNCTRNQMKRNVTKWNATSSGILVHVWVELMWNSVDPDTYAFDVAKIDTKQ